MTVESLFYRQNLPPSEAKVYDAVMDGLAKRSGVIEVRTMLPASRINDVCLRVLSDNPVVYDVFSFMYRTSLGKVEIQPQYRVDASEYEQVSSACMRRILDVLPGLVVPGNEYDTVLNIHDHIVRNVTYSRDIEDFDHTCANPILLGKGVCDGISKMFKIMCNLADIECTVVTGNADTGERREAHAWNIVRIDGNWYNVDVTFDLNSRFEELSRDYFCMSDADISGDHTPDRPLNLCPDGSLYYHRKVGITIRDMNGFDTVIDVMRSRNGTTLSFKVDGDWDPEPEVLLNRSARVNGALFAQYGISGNRRSKVYTIHRTDTLRDVIPSSPLNGIFGLFGLR